MLITISIHDGYVKIITDHVSIIKITMGIMYIIELLFHPYQSIYASCLYYVLNYFPNKKSIPNKDLDILFSGTGFQESEPRNSTNRLINLVADYKRCYDEWRAAIERSDPVQTKYYHDKLKRIEKMINDDSYNQPQSFINPSCRSVLDGIRYAMKQFKSESPIFNQYLETTLILNSRLSYKPNLDKENELIIKEYD